MDYKKEYETLKAYEPKDYFKTNAGSYKITILTEPENTNYDDDGKDVEQIELQISVKQKVYYWTITKGLSFKSLYGQLMALGNAKGKLRELTITLLVTGTEKNKTHVVLEALPYIETLSNAEDNV